MAAHTLGFASICEPGIPIDSIEIWKSSTREVIRTQSDKASLITCENHWIIVFKFGGYQAIATKHRGSDLNWHQNDFNFVPSVVLKFEPLPSCPPMDDVAWEICAAEKPDTKALDCIPFVYNFIMAHVNQQHIRGPVKELREHLYTSPGAASAELSREMA